MNKFKFGDMVLHNEHGIGIVTKDCKPYRNIPVIFQKELVIHWLPFYDLKPILHPDTVRLDWLETHGWRPKTIAGGIIPIHRTAIDRVINEFENRTEEQSQAV